MNTMTIGERNVAIGNDALTAGVEDSYNVAIGYEALHDQNGGGSDGTATATHNTMVGYQAGDTITTGKFNTGFGSGVTFDIDANNQTAIGYGATTDSANDIAIGNTSVDEIKGQVDFSTFSDERIKKDIIDGDLGLDFINKLKPRKFKKVNPNEYPDEIRKPADESATWSDEQENKVWDGLIAQEVKEVIDKLGTTFSGWNEESNSKQLVAYSSLVTPLIKSVQELTEMVKSQQKEIEELKKQ